MAPVARRERVVAATPLFKFANIISSLVCKWLI
jgi:hypothetical protein